MSGPDRRVGIDAVTGHRDREAISKVGCAGVAALFAAAILRRNPDSVVIPFDVTAFRVNIDPRDTILSLAARVALYGGQPMRESTTRSISMQSLRATASK